MTTTSPSYSPEPKVLGIFGQLDPDQEKHFQDLSTLYSHFPSNEDSIGIFNHLSLIIDTILHSNDISTNQKILQQLQSFLPLQLDILHPVIIEDHHLALSFNPTQLQSIHQIFNKSKIGNIIQTNYIKVIRFVPQSYQSQVMDILRQTKSLTISNFVLCVNNLNQASIIASTNNL